MHSEILTALFEQSDHIDVPATFADPTEPDCPLIHCNPAFEALTGYAHADVIGKNCRFLQGTTLDSDERRTLRTATRDQKSCSVVLSNQRADGSQFNNFLFVEPIVIAKGRTILMGCQHDFRNFRSFDGLFADSQIVLRNQERIKSCLDQSKTMFRESLVMRSETAVMMMRNYLVRRSNMDRNAANLL